jgi:hypothetical protein
VAASPDALKVKLHIQKVLHPKSSTFLLPDMDAPCILNERTELKIVSAIYSPLLSLRTMLW